ncbi:hypothetical protein Tco_1410762 [Tanacetum coccineum]
MQGLAVEVDLYVLPMKGPDVVLGIQWLQNKGKVTHNYVEQTMEFILEGVESVMPVLQEDGRYTRPKREKSKPESQSRVLFKQHLEGKKLGFSEWIEVHTLASKNKSKENDISLKNLKAKFEWIKTQDGKLGIPPPHELSAFGISAAKKKRKRSSSIIKEVFVVKDIVVDGMHKNFSSSRDEMLKFVCDILHHRLWNFKLGYNKYMPRRKWTATDQRQSGIMVKLIDEQLLDRRIMQNLERLVGARELEMDYRLMQRTI